MTYKDTSALRDLRARLTAAQARIGELEAEIDVWRSAVADAVEPLGFDREAADGPADLLPGLLTLAELAAVEVAAYRARIGLPAIPSRL